MEHTEKLTLRECMFGDRAFYRHVLTVVLPIIIQNTLTNIVSLLDNVMVGQVGTLPMSGVAIVGQLLFVYYLCIWGSTAGAGIFGAQFDFGVFVDMDHALWRRANHGETDFCQRKGRNRHHALDLRR